MSKVVISFRVNGEPHEIAVAPHRTLAELLREELQLTGTKVGCETGDCGACTVLLDGRTVTSCLTLAVEVDGRDVTTIEGVARTSPTGQVELDPLQESFVRSGAVQCGYCTPGMVLSARWLLSKNPHPTETEIRQALSGNLCRCTGYENIVKAIAAVAAAPSWPDLILPRPAAESERRRIDSAGVSGGLRGGRSGSAGPSGGNEE